MTGTEPTAGEYLIVSERLIVAPAPGRFEPSVPDGDHVACGQTVGTVVRADRRFEVVSQVTGRFMGHLADPGERVRDGQPLAWVRLAG
jgi:biotin carboxyl carrier protein